MAETNFDLEQANKEASSRLENIVGKINVKQESLDAGDLKQYESSSGSNLENYLDSESATPTLELSENKLREKYTKQLTENLRGLSTADEHEKQKMIERFTLSELAINKLESGPVLEEAKIFSSLEKQIHRITDMSDQFKQNNVLNIDAVRNFVHSLIVQTGPNKNASLLLLNLIDTEQEQYFGPHSINTCIFSLIMAIDVSKMMMQKILLPEVSKDFRKTRICSLKVFNEQELLDLGIAAVLHDLHLKKMFPNLTTNTYLSFRDHLEYKRHPIETVRLLEKFKLSKEILIAIQQHHERLDGTGYPDGIHENVFSRFGRVLSLADRYENLAFMNPFVPTMGPIGAVNRILKHEKAGFDGDLIISFIKSTTLYPPGSFIILNTGEIGMVSETNDSTMHRPRVKILFSKNQKQVQKPFMLDLNNYPDIKPARAIHPGEIKTSLPILKEQLGLIA